MSRARMRRSQGLKDGFMATAEAATRKENNISDQQHREASSKVDRIPNASQADHW